MLLPHQQSIHPAKNHKGIKDPMLYRLLVKDQLVVNGVDTIEEAKIFADEYIQDQLACRIEAWRSPGDAIVTMSVWEYDHERKEWVSTTPV